MRQLHQPYQIEQFSELDMDYPKLSQIPLVVSPSSSIHLLEQAETIHVHETSSHI
jgi:hypothetical protein